MVGSEIGRFSPAFGFFGLAGGAGQIFRKGSFWVFFFLSAVVEKAARSVGFEILQCTRALDLLKKTTFLFAEALFSISPVTLSVKNVQGEKTAQETSKKNLKV